MASNALTRWQTDRAARLDRLELAHATVIGRTLTEGLNRAMVIQLAAEFQGFARDLHDEAAEAVAAGLAPGDRQRQDLLVLPYRNRRLARGNADPGTLGHDFTMFGVRFWHELRDRFPTRGKQWHDRLVALNEARNGLAHADEQRIARVVAAGWRLNRGSVRRWRGTLDGLAGGMDRMIGDHLRRSFGVSAW